MAVTGTQVLGGRYVLSQVLGVGGMATVWRARDEVLSRDVAVKVLNPQYAADAGFLARFEREAQHAAGLSHPRLVTVFDSGVDGTMPFIVMELLAGRTLRQVLDEAGALPASEAADIAAAVCEALEVAHAAGLVHRDIKPANIVLGAGGQVKVLDFGIARAEGTGGTRTLAVLGTAAYLSPEQASGHPSGPQADLYSLGCVLYEMLTGAPPFAADSAVGLAYRQVHDHPGPPSARRTGLPERLDQVTLRLLAKDPTARPASAAAARAELLAALLPNGATPSTAKPGATAVDATAPDGTAVLPPTADLPLPGAPFSGGPVPGGAVPGGAVPGGPAPGRSVRRRAAWRPRPVEIVLAAALAATLAALAAVLLIGADGVGGAAPSAAHRAGSRQPSQTPHAASKQPGTHAAARQQTGALPPAAAAVGTFVGDLEAGVTDGQVTQQAGQDLFNHLQQLLFQPGQTALQIQQQYQQLVQSYDQHQSQGQITGPAVAQLRRALAALGAAVGAL